MNDLAGTPADRLLEAQRHGLNLDWLKLPLAEALTAMAVLTANAKQDLFAWCVAACLKPQLAIEDRADPAIESAGSRLAIPFADFWRPTTANYWGRVKKAHGLAIGKEILGNRWARDHADDKKPILAAALEAAFDPAQNTACIGLDQAARDAAGAWLPPGIAYAANAGALATDTDGADRPEVTKRFSNTHKRTKRELTPPAMLGRARAGGTSIRHGFPSPRRRPTRRNRR